MKSYTDLKQSKKLAEILPKESADQTWEIIAIAGANLGIPEEMEYWHNGNTPCILNSKIGIPCWSLAALLDILPSEFKYYETTYEIDIRKYMLTDDVDLYQIAYRNCKIDEDGHHSWKDMVNTGEKENLIDACVEMILKLHEQKLI